MSPQLIRLFRAWEICLSESSLSTLAAVCLLSASVFSLCTCVYSLHGEETK